VPSAAEQQYFVGTTSITNVEELVRPCGTLPTRQLRRMLRGLFIENGIFTTTNYCVIKLPAEEGNTECLRTEIKNFMRLKEVNRAAIRTPLRMGNLRGLSSVSNLNTAPGCVACYYFSESSIGPYLVLEDHYRDIRGQLHDTPADPRWADYRILAGMFKALRALHGAGFVHCNIKPENVLYRVTGDFECVIKFCDLKYACLSGDDVALPKPSGCTYLSPNAYHSVAAGQKARATYSLDVFALAIVMWQILQRSTSSLLHVGCSVYQNGDEQCGARLVEMMSSDEETGSASANYHVKSYAHFVPLLIEMVQLSLSGNCSLGTHADLLDQLHDLEPEDATQAKLDKILGVVTSEDRKRDSALKAIRTSLRGIRSSVTDVTKYSRVAATRGTNNAKALGVLAKSMKSAAHGLSTTVSVKSSTSKQLSAAVHECVIRMKNVLASNLRDSSVKQMSLSTALERIQEHLHDISEEAKKFGAVAEEDHKSRSQIQKISESTLMCVNDFHAELKAAAITQAQWHSASSVTTHSLLTGEYAVPTKFVLLPELVDNTWMGQLNPMRWVGNKYRLYFVCEQTHQIVCGPDHEGYEVQQLQDWVVQAAPYVQIALVAVSAALVISGVPFPISKWCQIPPNVPHQTKYLCAVFTFIHDAAGSTACEYTAEQLAAMDDLNEDDLTCGEHDRARAAQLISDLKDRKVITDWSGLVLVNCTVTGHSAWVRDNAVIQQAWKDAWPSRLHKQVEAIVRMHTGSIVAVGRAMQYDLLFNEQAVVRVENLVKDITSAAETLNRQGPAEDPQNRIDDCSTALSAAVAMFAPIGSRDTLLHASSCYTERDSELRKKIYTQVELMRATAPHHVPTAWQKAIVAITEGLKASVAKLRQLVDDTRCLRDFRTSSAKAVSDSIELSECVQVLTSPGTKRNCPQLPVLLPSVPRGWKGAGQPLRLRKNKCRLLFLCSHTKLPLLCGLDGAGHYITADAASVNKLAPVVQISLLLLASALKRPECGALPVVFFGAKLDTKELQLQYLNAVLDLMTKPVSVNEETYTLDEVPSEVGDANQMDLEALQHDHTNVAYNELLRLLQLHSLQREKCSEWGMRLVGHLWVTDSDEIEAEVAPLLASP
jgi:serine/threonine protein kinase